MLQKLALSLTVLAAATAAQATQYNAQRVYFVQYHFTTEAFGKQVSSVKLTTGVLSSWCGAAAEWVDVKQLDMKRDGNKFNARAELLGSVSSSCGGAIAPIVQYTVSFTDGSVFVTNSAQVPTQSAGTFNTLEEGKEFDAARAQQEATLNTAASADGTQAVVIESGFAD